MTATIALLADDVINQIAAGEVIENPASVVKELVDNAIDAKASQIQIDIQAGGQQLILVEDDGCGMTQEDAKLCLLRHATSKIKSIEDLDVLKTMGFRGEALAAIAAISHLQIITSNGVEGTRLQTAAGQIQLVEPAARNRGTSIEVRSLFFNTPARRKFQKSPQSCTTAIMRMIQSLALAHPEKAFKLSSQGQVLFDVHPAAFKERIEQVIGVDICRSGFWLGKDDQLSGWLGAFDEARSTRLGQYFFLNRRPIFSPLLSRAVREGYGTRIAEGTHPACVLMLEKDPSEFDVNVHPQKREVRFCDEGELFRQIREAIQKNFLPCTFTQEIHFQPRPNDPWEQPSTVREPSVAERISEPTQLWPERSDAQALAVVGSFLLIQRDREVRIVDMRQAQEEKALVSHEKQSLLVPIQLAISPDEEISNLLERCSEAGLDAKVLGPHRLCLDALPEWLSPSDAPKLIDALKEDGLVKDIVHRFCREIPKLWTLQEAEWLWRKGAMKEVPLEMNDLERIFVKRA